MWHLLTSLFNIFLIPGSSVQVVIIFLILCDKVATEQFYLSVDAAANLCNFTGLDESKTAIGANSGLGTHIKPEEKWHLKPELKPLSRKRARAINSITIVAEELSVDVNSI